MLAFLVLALIATIVALVLAFRNSSGGGDLEGTARFAVVVLGSSGGVYEAGLSAYLLQPLNRPEWASDPHFLSLDAGSSLSGIRSVIANGSFEPLRPHYQAYLSELSAEERKEAQSFQGWILRTRIRGYALSHPHLDHILGLAVSSVADARLAFPGSNVTSPKPLLCSNFTAESLKQHVFNGKVWPNFATEGFPPALGTYSYEVVPEGRNVSVPGTCFVLQRFPLYHGHPYESAAFLVGCEEDYVLYLGDVGPDTVEEQRSLTNLWTAVAPYIRAKQLKAIFIECSYPNWLSRLLVVFFRLISSTLRVVCGLV